MGISFYAPRCRRFDLRSYTFHGLRVSLRGLASHFDGGVRAHHTMNSLQARRCVQWRYDHDGWRKWRSAAVLRA